MAHHLALPRHFGNGRRYVIGIGILVGQLSLSPEHLAAFVASLGQGALHGIERGLVDQGPNQVVLARVANAYLAVGGLDPSHHFILDRTVHDEAAQRGAALPSRADCREENAPHGQVQVGARCQDHCIVAAKFQDAAAEACGYTRPDFTAHARAAGGTHQGHAGVIDQGFACFTAADDQLRKTCRRIAEGFQRLVEQRLARQGGQWRFLGGLPYNRVAGHKGQGGVPRPDRHREVERADHTDHTQRVPAFAHVVARALGSDGQAVQLA